MLICFIFFFFISNLIYLILYAEIIDKVIPIIFFFYKVVLCNSNRKAKKLYAVHMAEVIKEE